MTDENAIAIQISIPEDLKVAKNTNLARISSVPSGEIFLDFLFVHPNDTNEKGEKSGTLVSRLALTKDMARTLQILLNNHIGKIKSE